MTKDGSASSPSLNIVDIPKPTIKPGQLLVKIHATPVLPADILNSKGGFSSTTYPRVPGKDFAGTVEDGSAQWKGKNVFGSSGSVFSYTKDGSQAEYGVNEEVGVAPMPQNLSFPQAASLGTPFLTADLILQRAAVTSSDTVMVLGATGSVGSAVVQIAKLKGAKTITVGRYEVDINSTEDPELKPAKTLTAGKGPSVIVDTVGNFALVEAALAILSDAGRFVFITAPRQGSTQLPVDVKDLYRREISLIGCNSSAQTLEDIGATLAELSPSFESGQLLAPEESTLNMISVDEAPQASLSLNRSGRGE